MSASDDVPSLKKRRLVIEESDSDDDEDVPNKRIGAVIDLLESQELSVSVLDTIDHTMAESDPIDFESDEEVKLPSEHKDKGALWTDLYAPTTATELAVNAKKIELIRDALLLSVTGRYRMVLVTGPTGCGKSATVRVLSKELNIDLEEWNTPVVSSIRDASDKPLWYTSVLDDFNEFLMTSGRYSSVVRGNRATHALFIDDPPYLHDTKQKMIFGGIIRKFIIGGATRHGSAPLIIVSVDADTRFPIDVLQSPAVRRVELRASATTFVKKALKRISTAEGLSGVHKYINDASIACNGDVRSAIHDMQFRRVRVLNSRDGQLSFIHAIARIMHSKRKPDGSLDFDPQTVLDTLYGERSAAYNMVFSNSMRFLTKSTPSSHDMSCISQSMSESDVMSRFDWCGDTWLSDASLSVAVRGWLLYNNQCRVKEWLPLTGSKHIINDGVEHRIRGYLYNVTSSCSSMSTLAMDVLPLNVQPVAVFTPTTQSRELIDDPIEDL